MQIYFHSFTFIQGFLIFESLKGSKFLQHGILNLPLNTRTLSRKFYL